MKHLKYIIGTLIFGLLFFTSCQDEDIPFGDISAPSNVQISVKYLDDIDEDGDLDESTAPGLGSGRVEISATAENATSFHIVVEGQTILQKSGKVSYIFATLGEITYSITAVAYGTGGVSTSVTKEYNVLSLYEPPADLLQMLYGDGSRTWRIKSEAKDHFGLGAPGGTNPFEYYGAAAGDKSHVGMYDDRYIFNEDGTFTHITDSTNDDPTTDTSGTVFGREVLIQELNGAGGEAEGQDIIQYPYSDYTGQWSLSAPSDVETISLSGLSFIGYYVGGDHKYQILSRSENEMVIKTTDGNGQFDWGFTLIAE
ncbi:glucan endo-1,3-beta-D-glucosidase [Gaetbulibacter sp. M240]|uniref:glucan endo-1,3-beta-D-glucosidase n=1 Tax=Gaetbulibacter sp. M240 TaxID=3126511 RepID=UPI00374F6FB9